MQIESCALIILAGGVSSRMGSPKGLLRTAQNETLLRYSLEKFVSAGGKKAILIFGAHKKLYEAARRDWDLRQISVESYTNPTPSRGQFSSLRIAVEKLNRDENAFVLPVDVPAPSLQVWQKLAQELVRPIQVVQPTIENHGGHPVLLSAAFCKAIRNRVLDEKARLDYMIRELKEEALLRVEVNEPSIRMNLNTPEDFHKFINSTP